MRSLSAETWIPSSADEGVRVMRTMVVVVIVMRGGGRRGGGGGGMRTEDFVGVDGDVDWENGFVFGGWVCFVRGRLRLRLILQNAWVYGDPGAGATLQTLLEQGSDPGPTKRGADDAGTDAADGWAKGAESVGGRSCCSLSIRTAPSRNLTAPVSSAVAAAAEISCC